MAECTDIVLGDAFFSVKGFSFFFFFFCGVNKISRKKKLLRITGKACLVA